jgi:hypothetical protein
VRLGYARNLPGSRDTAPRPIYEGTLSVGGDADRVDGQHAVNVLCSEAARWVLSRESSNSEEAE